MASVLHLAEMGRSVLRPYDKVGGSLLTLGTFASQPTPTLHPFPWFLRIGFGTR